MFITSFGASGSNVGQLMLPGATSVGPTGNIAVADSGNHRVQVLRSIEVPAILRADVTDPPSAAPAVQWQYLGQTFPSDTAVFGRPFIMTNLGVVTATVTATDACGATASRSVPITAAESWPVPPLGGVGCSVAIDARFPPFAPAELTAVVLGLDTDQPLFEWDFGDGTPLVPTLDSQVRHVYSPAGMYFVRVVVFDADGTCTGTRKIDVQ